MFLNIQKEAVPKKLSMWGFNMVARFFACLLFSKLPPPPITRSFRRKSHFAAFEIVQLPCHSVERLIIQISTPINKSVSISWVNVQSSYCLTF